MQGFDQDTRELMDCLQKGKALVDDGKHAAALQSYERALQLASAAGPHAAYVEQVLDGLAECQSQTGNHTGAADNLRRLLALKEKTYGASHLQSLRTGGRLGKELHRCGKTKEAISLLQKTCQSAEAVMRRSDATLIGMLEIYEAALRADGARAAADQIAAKVEAARNSSKSASGQRRAAAKSNGMKKPLIGLGIAVAILVAGKLCWDFLAKPTTQPAPVRSEKPLK